MELRGVGLVLAALLAPAMAAGEGAPRYGGTIRATVLGAVSIPAPLTIDNHADATVSQLIFDSLYRIDDRGHARPHLAADMPVINGKVVRIRVRKGVRFHDGTTFTARAAASSLRGLMRSPKWGWILGAVKTIDARGQWLVLRLRRAEPELVRILAAPQAGISRSSRAATWRTQGLVGTGPFKLQPSASSLRLLAWDEHFAGRPYIDSLELSWHAKPKGEAKAYELGRSHTSLRGPVAFAGHRPKWAARSVATPTSVLVYLGTGRNVLAGDFGHAISLALDRRAFSGVGTGERVWPSGGPVSPNLGGASGPIAARLDRAKRMLERARSGNPGLAARIRRPLEIRVDRTRPDDREIADRVLSTLYRLGIPSRVKVVSGSELRRGDLYVDHLVTPVASPGWQAAAAVAVHDGAWLRAQLRRRAPRTAAMEARLRKSRHLIPLFHRAVRMHVRSNLHGFAIRANGLISFEGVFEHGKPRRPRARRRR
ncbi:MAG: hypothetical protein KJO07_00250 [Deltaproteobacteria bacterium]|nr:hypothetical protein [Deltaproteobacteria bacterium]